MGLLRLGVAMAAPEGRLLQGLGALRRMVMGTHDLSFWAILDCVPVATFTRASQAAASGTVTEWLQARMM
jgi:hypothetical protein